MLLRQEDHADAVLAGWRQRDAERRHLGAVELVGDLDQDAGAVAHQRVGADRAAVVEVLEDLQPLLDDPVRFLPGDVGHEADAAGVVLARRIVESGLGRDRDFAARGWRRDGGSRREVDHGWLTVRRRNRKNTAVQHSQGDLPSNPRAARTRSVAATRGG